MNLYTIIQNEIQKNSGYISFSRFMQLALYDPNYGYYQSNKDQFGKQGDFVTAPEISPLFAQCIATSVAPMLTKNADFLEIGAGSGQFAHDFLLFLEKQNRLPRTYFIYEISETLKLKQQAFLQQSCPKLYDRIQWLKHLPTEFQGIIFANEVMDALPVNCFIIENDEMLERCVGFANNHFAWSHQKTDIIPQVAALQKKYHLPNGYQSEINLFLPEWITGLCTLLKEGLMLLFDYGYPRHEYYHPNRHHGTLMCFYKHQKHDNPFTHLGKQDLTAHVDFTTVAETALKNQLSFVGFTTQAGFLLECDLLKLAELNSQNLIADYQQNQAIKKLTLPSEMGEIVKVIGFSKGDVPKIIGFDQFSRHLEIPD